MLWFWILGSIAIFSFVTLGMCMFILAGRADDWLESRNLNKPYLTHSFSVEEKEKALWEA